MKNAMGLFSRMIGRFRLDRFLIALLCGCGVALGGLGWLQENPQHNPWSPLDLRDPVGWATEAKLATLRSDPQACRDTLERSNVSFTLLDPVGEGACRREDRTAPDELRLAGRTPAMTCPTAAAMTMWLDKSLDVRAREHLGSKIARVEHFGTFSCRRVYGREEGPWSEHATANAIDISGFVLEDGRSISVLDDWDGGGAEAQFLRDVRDDSCQFFATVLSPDYNDAHRDHFHLDQADRRWGLCR